MTLFQRLIHDAQREFGVTVRMDNEGDRYVFTLPSGACTFMWRQPYNKGEMPKWKGYVEGRQMQFVGYRHNVADWCLDILINGAP